MAEQRPLMSALNKLKKTNLKKQIYWVYSVYEVKTSKEVWWSTFFMLSTAPSLVCPWQDIIFILMFCSRIQHKSESFQFHLVLETDSLKEHYFFKQMKAEVLLTQLEK